MHVRLLYIVALVFCGSLSGLAKDKPLTVLELFTSQACGGCISADATLRAQREKDDILVLSWPVDYFDRFGWVDTFADPANTWRQKAYNKRLGKGGMVYTPEMIIDGRRECVGNDKAAIREEIESARALDYERIIPVINEDDGKYTVTLPETRLENSVFVRAVWYLSDSTIEVTGGENAGKWLHLSNVVRHSKVMAEWDGKAQTYAITPGGDALPTVDGVAVLLHDGYGHGAIVGAAATKVSAP